MACKRDIEQVTKGSRLQLDGEVWVVIDVLNVQIYVEHSTNSKRSKFVFFTETWKLL